MNSPRTGNDYSVLGALRDFGAQMSLLKWHKSLEYFQFTRASRGMSPGVGHTLH